MRLKQLLSKDGRRVARNYVADRAAMAAFAPLQRAGIHLIRNSYYSAIPDTRSLRADFGEHESAMVGVGIDLDQQQALAQLFAEKYRAEFAAWPTSHATDHQPFSLDNSSFGSIDAETYWGFLREFKPKRVIEIGSGNSTLLAMDALDRNAAEGHHTDYLVIDPFPRVRAAIAARTDMRLDARPVQDVPLEVFEALEDGDILFIDSTHVAKMGSDVLFELLEVVPRVARGVYVHFHDILLPRNYPQLWIDHLYFWNEQYLLQAFLAFNSAFTTLWSGNLMAVRRPDALASAFASFGRDTTNPGSYWIRRVE